MTIRSSVHSAWCTNRGALRHRTQGAAPRGEQRGAGRVQVDGRHDVGQIGDERTRVYFERILESDAKPLDKLRELITVETAHTASNLTKSSLFYTEWRSLSPERQRPILVERARHENAVEQWIRAAQSAGGIRADVDPKIVTLAVFGMVNSVYRWFQPDGRRSAEEIGREFSDLVINGLIPH